MNKIWNNIVIHVAIYNIIYILLLNGPFSMKSIMFKFAPVVYMVEEYIFWKLHMWNLLASNKMYFHLWIYLLILNSFLCIFHYLLHIFQSHYLQKIKISWNKQTNYITSGKNFITKRGVSAQMWNMLLHRGVEGESIIFCCNIILNYPVVSLGTSR